MLDLTKIYTAKASATRAMKKAGKDGELNTADYSVEAVEGGFQILAVNKTEIREYGPSEFCDEELENKYSELAGEKFNDVPGGKALAENWYIFDAGTTAEEIDAWFDSEYSEGLAALKSKMSDGGNSGGESDSADENARSANENDAKADENAKPADTFALAEKHKCALNALAGVKILAEKSEDERAGIWFPFAEIYNSTKPADIPKRSMGGVMRALINRGFIQFNPDGKEIIGKKAVAVCITNAGLAALHS